jgi:hypothetical protein
MVNFVLLQHETLKNTFIDAIRLFEVFKTMKIQVVVFRFVTPCNDVVGSYSPRLQDEVKMAAA